MKIIRKLLLTAVVLSAIFVSCRGNKARSIEIEEPVRIGIAWRADTTSEFYTNTVRALREAGAEPVLLSQVRMSDFGYSSPENSLDSAYFDENGILLEKYADMLKRDPRQGCLRTIDYSHTNVSTSTEGVDAVVFTGGEDIAPTLLRKPEPWHGIEAEKDYNATRDVSDYLTMSYCLDQDIPVMGMCRGMQMLVVVSGGTIIQDLPTYFAQEKKKYNYEHRNNVEAGQYRDYAPHNVDVTDHESWLYKSVGSDVAYRVPSWHHQAAGSVDSTALRVTGTTTVDGIATIEAVERRDKRFAVGLQYHPEAALVKHLDKAANASQFMSHDEALAYFKILVEQARKHQKAKQQQSVAASK